MSYSHVDNSFLIRTNNSTALTLDASQNATFAGTIAVQGTGASYFTGNVGIGTTLPAALLHIKEPTATTSQIRMSATSNEANYGYLTMTDNTVNTAKLTFGTTYGYNTPVPAMTVWNGMIGIGTTSPSKQLQLRGSAPFIRLEEDSASNKRLDLWVDPTSAIGYIGANQSAQQLSFQTSNSDRIRILNNGNVGIGTTSPSQKLDVVGEFY